MWMRLWECLCKHLASTLWWNCDTGVGSCTGLSTQYTSTLHCGEPSGEASATKAGDLRGRSHYLPSHASDFRFGTPGVTLHSIISSVLGQVGQVSLYGKWVKWKIYQQLFISVWHTYSCWSTSVLEIHTVCCLDVKQPRSKLECNSVDQMTRGLFCWGGVLQASCRSWIIFSHQTVNVRSFLQHPLWVTDSEHSLLSVCDFLLCMLLWFWPINNSLCS